MKRSMRLAILALTALALAISGCDLLGDLTGGTTPGGNDGPAYATNVVVVSANITGAVTWDAAKVYYTNDAISIDNGSSLTIPAGTIVKFGTYGNLTVANGANLNAGSSTGNPVIFTSIRDVRGGDSITNDAITLPAKGDWGYVSVIGNAVLNNCEFAYAGSADNYAALEVSGAATIDGCVIHDTGAGNILSSGYAALHAVDSYSGTTITNCVFYNNDWPLAVYPGLNMDDTNVFEFDPDSTGPLPVLKNTHQAVFLSDGSISGAVSWGVTTVPYVSNSTYNIDSGSSLTIDGLAIVKFVAGNSCEINVYSGGTLNRGTAIFTEYRDDVHGGDTNADNNTTSPAAEAWEGIWYEATGWLTDDPFVFYEATH